MGGPLRISLVVPEPSLILLVAPSGAGKSTLARRLFAPYEVVSSDQCRTAVSNDPTNQAASEDAFRLVHLIARLRLRRGLLTVVDATNVASAGRRPLRKLAQELGVPFGAIVLDLPEDELRARNASRTGRLAVPDRVVTLQLEDFASAFKRFRFEGMSFVHVLKSQDEMDRCEIDRVPFSAPDPPAAAAPDAPSSPRARRRT